MAEKDRCPSGSKKIGDRCRITGPKEKYRVTGRTIDYRINWDGKWAKGRNMGKHHCDYCGKRLWVNPGRGIYCNSTHKMREDWEPIHILGQGDSKKITRGKKND